MCQGICCTTDCKVAAAVASTDANNGGVEVLVEPIRVEKYIPKLLEDITGICASQWELVSESILDGCGYEGQFENDYFMVDAFGDGGMLMVRVNTQVAEHFCDYTFRMDSITRTFGPSRVTLTVN